MLIKTIKLKDVLDNYSRSTEISCYLQISPWITLLSMNETRKLQPQHTIYVSQSHFTTANTIIKIFIINLLLTLLLIINVQNCSLYMR